MTIITEKRIRPGSGWGVDNPYVPSMHYLLATIGGGDTSPISYTIAGRGFKHVISIRGAFKKADGSEWNPIFFTNDADCHWAHFRTPNTLTINYGANYGSGAIVGVVIEGFD